MPENVPKLRALLFAFLNNRWIAFSLYFIFLYVVVPQVYDLTKLYLPYFRVYCCLFLFAWQYRAKNIVPKRMREMEAAIIDKDFDKFAELTMKVK